MTKLKKPDKAKAQSKSYKTSEATRLSAESISDDSIIDFIIKTGRLPEGAWVSPEAANSFLASFSPLYNDNDESLRDVIMLPISPTRLVEQMQLGFVNKAVFADSSIRAAAVMLGTTNKSGVTHKAVQFLINSRNSLIWQKYLLAHMLGHFFNGHYSPLATIYETKKTMTDLNASDTREMAANLWAMNFLVPPDILSDAIASKSSVSDIIDLFEVPSVVLKAQSNIIGHPLPIFHTTDVDVPDSMEWLQ